MGEGDQRGPPHPPPLPLPPLPPLPPQPTTLPSTSTSNPNSDSLQTTSTGAPFIAHKVSSKDTLAGIAIKYHVSVADLKRFNGLLSDSAMYALDVIMVPTKLIPVGTDLQVIFAQVASGFGRDPVLNAECSMAPASTAAARVARSLTMGTDNGDGSDAWPQGEDPWFCQTCGMDYGECDRATCQAPTSNHHHFEPGEVELMERSPEPAMVPSTSGPTRLHDPMRRRRGAPGSGSDDVPPGGGLPPRPPGHSGSAACLGRMSVGAGGAAAAPVASTSAPGGAGGLFSLRQLSELGRAIGDSRWVQRIKAAATQPVALGTRRMSSLSDAADGVLGSFRQGGMGGSSEGGGGGSMRRVSSAASGLGRWAGGGSGARQDEGNALLPPRASHKLAAKSD